MPPAAMIVATAAGGRPLASATTMAARTPREIQACVPRGMSCRRTASSGSTTRTRRVFEVLAERRPSALEEQGVAGRELRLAGAVSPPRWTLRTMRSPLSVTMPGNTSSPMASERGGMTTSATPVSLVKTILLARRRLRWRATSTCVSRSQPATMSGSPRTTRMSPATSAGRASGPKPPSSCAEMS